MFYKKKCLHVYNVPPYMWLLKFSTTGNILYIWPLTVYFSAFLEVSYLSIFIIWINNLNLIVTLLHFCSTVLLFYLRQNYFDKSWIFQGSTIIQNFRIKKHGIFVPQKFVIIVENKDFSHYDNANHTETNKFICLHAFN